MAGKLYTIKLRETSTSAVELTGLTIVDFDDTNLEETTSSVVKNDFPDSLLDEWTVKVAYVEADIPDDTMTVADIMTAATDAINEKYDPVAEVVSL